ncbi:MAG: phosphatidylserine/phosphatidylglycerophosphate/cardiolipin synthase family protein [Halodesulfurarchaeum sp.]
MVQTPLVLVRVLLLSLLATSGNVTIQWIYPNPATDGDVGEFIVVHSTPGTNTTGLTLTDGEDSVALENISSGTVAIGGVARIPRQFTDYAVYTVSSFLSLSNSGDTVTLRRHNRTVATLSYRNAGEAERFDGRRFTPIGRTDFGTVTARQVDSTAFVLPDSNRPIRRVIEGASHRVFLGGYTLSDSVLVEDLRTAKRRGVDVRVLIEGGPVGGMSAIQATQMEHLIDAGVPVRVMGGDRARYDYHHAKYAVVDDRILVTSENWKPGGAGGHGSRGWGIVLENERLADQLARVFVADSRWNSTRSWSRGKPSTFQPADPSTASFPSRFDSVRTEVNSATVLVAPDNAKDAILRRIRHANRSITIQQVGIERKSAVINETIDAARRGVRVRILVSGAWFVESENRRFLRWIRELSRTQHLPISARLTEPRSRFEYSHNKGLIVDGRYTLVGSINWNTHSLTENREVAVLVDDRSVARYYRRIFRADWRGAAYRVPVIVLATGFLAVSVAFGFARMHATFESERQRGFGPPRR